MGQFTEEVKRVWSEIYTDAEPDELPTETDYRTEIMTLMSKLNGRDRIISKQLDDISLLRKENVGLMDRLVESEANLLSVRQEKGLYWDEQKANAPYRENPYLKYAIYTDASDEINGRLDDGDE